MIILILGVLGLCMCIAAIVFIQHRLREEWKEEMNRLRGFYRVDEKEGE